MTDSHFSELHAASAARMIDHTLLAPEAGVEDIRKLCDEALRYGFFAVCVNPWLVSAAVEALADSPFSRSAPLDREEKEGAERRTRRETALSSADHGSEGEASGYDRPVVASVVGFPLGANTIEVKATEAARAIEDGAREIDMVISLGALCSGDHHAVRTEIEAVGSVVHQTPGALLKVILETAALTEKQIISGCRCAAEGEADFVKTSTGFHPGGGATAEHVRLLHRHASPIRVKASGGIRTVEAFSAMVAAGACRIGTSSGVALVETLQQRGGSPPC